MRPRDIPDVAQAFLDAYRDPEIDKRLFFEVWADRTGCNPVVKQQVWEEVRRITYRIAAQKRQVVRQRRAVRAEARRAWCNEGFEAAM